jgi:hypothetical protein
LHQIGYSPLGSLFAALARSVPVANDSRNGTAEGGRKIGRWGVSNFGIHDMQNLLSMEHGTNANQSGLCIIWDPGISTVVEMAAGAQC